MSTLFVQLAVNVPSVAGVFDYAVPGGLTGDVGPGTLVVAPFGKQTVQGVVLRILDRPSVPVVKEITQIVDSLPVLTQAQIALAEQVAQGTMSPLAAIVDLFLPPGLNQQADVSYSVVDEPHSVGELGETQKRLLKLLRERSPLRGRQIDQHFRHVDWRRAGQQLVRRGILESRPVLPQARVRPKFVRTAQLAVSPEVAEMALPQLGRTESTQTRRQRALRMLMLQPHEVNVAWVYAESGCNPSDLQELAERELILLRETEIFRDPLNRLDDAHHEAGTDHVLTAAQQGAWHELESGFRQLSEGRIMKAFLLDGVTGSGKTELYIRAAQEAIRRGKQAIILVPEISLTPQTVRRFHRRFPGQVGLIHSKLSEGERYDTWRRARAGLIKVVIGARSAIFAPLPDIGLIVLDECHDSSYYQSEQPFYHTVTVGRLYARLTGALCLLGSATPSTIQRYQAERGEIIRLELPTRAAIGKSSTGQAGLPPVTVVDMREELKAGQRGMFSRQLLERLESTLARGEQAILFLNRRGTATYIFCRECGHVIKCPRCDTPMTLHVGGGERLLCHHCGYQRNLPKSCPACGGVSIGAYGLGSEKVEREVQAQFPTARTLRWDWETTRQKGSHEIILSHFAARRADVLVGTQMLAKGLDLPLVTLVGIVFADVGLNLPDPFSVERVFQTLTHVAGRAGRSERGGAVVLQTFSPDHYAIQAASKHDVNGFYQHELAQRRRLGYPPFARLVRLEFRHHDAGKAEQVARAMGSRLEQALIKEGREPADMIGPVPCFYAKLNGQYRWQIVLRGSDAGLSLHRQGLEGWRVEVEPISLL